MWNLSGCLRTHRGGKGYKVISTLTLHDVLGIKGNVTIRDRRKPREVLFLTEIGFTWTLQDNERLREVANGVTTYLCGTR